MWKRILIPRKKFVSPIVHNMIQYSPHHNYYYVLLQELRSGDIRRSFLDWKCIRIPHRRGRQTILAGREASRPFSKSKCRPTFRQRGGNVLALCSSGHQTVWLPRTGSSPQTSRNGNAEDGRHIGRLASGDRGPPLSNSWKRWNIK